MHKPSIRMGRAPMLNWFCQDKDLRAGVQEPRGQIVSDQHLEGVGGVGLVKLAGDFPWLHQMPKATTQAVFGSPRVPAVSTNRILTELEVM